MELVSEMVNFTKISNALSKRLLKVWWCLLMHNMQMHGC
jgi:hypothetical protein